MNEPENATPSTDSLLIPTFDVRCWMFDVRCFATGKMPVLQSRTRTSSLLHVIMRHDRGGGQNPAYATLDRSARARHSRHAALDSLDRDRHWTLGGKARSEEHTSELQSRGQLVCRL